MEDIIISNKRIGSNKPFIIAELSGNHNQSLDRAIACIDAAAKANVDAIKLQTYTADTMTLNLQEREFKIDDTNSLWYGQSLYQLYQKAYTPWEWHPIIFEHCKKLGILCFSTPFDLSAVDFLESLDVPLYKIASFEMIDLALVKKVSETGKPVIISTGMASLAEIDETVKVAREAGCKNLILLKCTSSYPASPADSNLLTIPHMQRLFNCHVGLSDHTLGIGAAIASIALGATVIEKHFTLSRADGGVDSAFSLEPNELKQLVEEGERAYQSLGKINYGLTEKEKSSLVFRRSLYVVEDIKCNEIFTEKNVRAIRPGLGLHPKYHKQFIGKQAKRDIQKGTPLNWDLI